MCTHIFMWFVLHFNRSLILHTQLSAFIHYFFFFLIVVLPVWSLLCQIIVNAMATTTEINRVNKSDFKCDFCYVLNHLNHLKYTRLDHRKGHLIFECIFYSLYFSSVFLRSILFSVIFLSIFARHTCIKWNHLMCNAINSSVDNGRHCALIP